MKPANLDHLVKRYLAGESALQLGKELGVKGETVSRWLKEGGIQLRGRTDAQVRRRLNTESRLGLDQEELARRYLAGESEKALAEFLGTNRGIVRRRLLDMGITPRGRSDAERIKWGRMTDAQRRRQVSAAHGSRVGRFEADLCYALHLAGHSVSHPFLIE